MDNESYQSSEYDVLVIGAGGAGLRAAIEASATGVSVGLICKSLLGKAHTVMAEGGMAASLANVDDRDNWTVHFADTMRGGQYLNSWRMAELHAQEAPARARELEAWGAVFDRTKDGRILQRNFGGHKYPRLAHVGDRTGLEMIRTLQDHGIHQGIDVHMECTDRRTSSKTATASSGALAYDREHGNFRVFKAQAPLFSRPAVIGQRLPDQLSNSPGTAPATVIRSPTTPGADLIDMEFIQFHPTGMVWPPGVKGILVTEGVRGEGGILLNSEGKRFMYDDDSGGRTKTQTAADRGRRLALRSQGDKQSQTARLSFSPAITSPAVSSVRSRKAAAARMAASSSTSPGSKRAISERRAEHIKQKAPEHVPPVQEARGHRHHRKSPWRSAPPPIT